MSGAATSTQKLPGAWRMFSAFGISVHLHWAWILVAFFVIRRFDEYSSPVFAVIEYLGLFGIVLLHEFGHALACKSVGGTAENIMLWPLGGVAYVKPPHRPGAVLWSIAAGPLVNVVLVPVLFIAHGAVSAAAPAGDLEQLMLMLAWINVVVLVFNMLPIYPLDGGQMLRAILWYFQGPHKSLTVAAAIGLVGAVAGVFLAISLGDIFLIVIAAFGAMSCWRGLKLARARRVIAQFPKRNEFACPHCGEAPPIGELWPCTACGGIFDAFAYGAICPHCKAANPATVCPGCSNASPITAFVPPPAAARFTDRP